MTFSRLRVADIIDETPDAKSFVLSVPNQMSQSFVYEAGQFLTLRIMHPDETLLRCYSLSSTPGVDQSLKVTVKRVAHGKASNWLHEAVRKGDVIECRAPAGRFRLQEPTKNIILFAGGSGITPIISILKVFLQGSIGRARLLFANRDANSIIFKTELDELSLRYSDRLVLRHHLDDSDGVASEDVVREIADGLESATAYLCGPRKFMEMVETQLSSLGLSSEQIIIERFQAGTQGAASSLDQDKLVPSEISVIVDGEEKRIPYRKGQSILTAARTAGIEVPSQCEEGYCGTCIGRRISGCVQLAINDVLSSSELESGLILTCQGYCSGKSVIVSIGE